MENVWINNVQQHLQVCVMVLLRRHLNVVGIQQQAPVKIKIIHVMISLAQIVIF